MSRLEDRPTRPRSAKAVSFNPDEFAIALEQVRLKCPKNLTAPLCCEIDQGDVTLPEREGRMVVDVAKAKDES